jgi:hypothetical protein
MPVTMEVGRIRSFDRSSPVHAYWLARCEGFEVRSGKESGVVEDVALDSTNHALYLVVRFGVARRREVPPSAVESVVPAEELLVVEAPEERPARVAPAARRAAIRGRSGVEAGAKASLAAATRVGLATGRAGGVAWREGRRGAVVTGRGSRRLSARAAPHALAALRQVGWAIHFALAWTTVCAAVLAGQLSRHGPPAARAVARYTAAGTTKLGSAAAAQARRLSTRAAATVRRRGASRARARGLRSRRPQDDVRVVDDLGEQGAAALDEPTLERMRDLRGAGRPERES